MHPRFVLLAALAWALGCAPAPAARQAAPDRGASRAEANASDFDALWSFVDEQYCFFDEKQTSWQAVRTTYRAQALAAVDDRALISVFEQVLDELYDPHTHLGVNLASSWRLPAHDLWAEWVDEAALVMVVRQGSAAEREGIRPGDVVVTIDGASAREAAAARMPKTLRKPDPEALGWALRSTLSGHHDRDRTLDIRRPDGKLETIVLAVDAEPERSGPAVNWRRLRPEVGYVRVSTFGDGGAVDAFDRALTDLRDTRALVIDVRDNTGGDTAIARPIMGRFIESKKAYAQMARREGKGLGTRWTEYVEPRGWTYRGGVVVLVDRFSVSMAEGFAMGMDGMGRGTVVGTPMAGLGAATGHVHLQHVDAGLQISTEPVYHVDGTPRWKLLPRIPVEIARDHLDPVLDAGLLEAERLVAAGALSSAVE